LPIAPLNAFAVPLSSRLGRFFTQSPSVEEADEYYGEEYVLLVNTAFRCEWK
jgi:hypothetical protein